MKKNIYFDNAASTPLDIRVFAAMKPYFTDHYGNPGSLHFFGQKAIAAIDASRETIARAIGAGFREVVFTGSATEANNLALRGVVAYYRRAHQDVGHVSGRTIASSAKPRIIISSIEHESIIETARALEKEGVEIISLPVDNRGVVDIGAVKTSLTKNTILVSIMYANNEIGTVQPLAECKKIIADYKNSLESHGNNIFPLLHTDASQAFQFFDCDVNNLGVDMMTLSAHKIYGPKGIGALYVRGIPKSSPLALPLEALITGGGQEFGMRSGTENVPLIVGFAKAMEIAVASRTKESRRTKTISNYFWSGIKKIDKTAELNGISFSEASVSQRLPNIVNAYFPKHSAEDLIVACDLAGVAISSGSACRSRAFTSSYVIEALGYPKERAASSVRFSFGRMTTKQEVQRALVILKKIL